MATREPQPLPAFDDARLDVFRDVVGRRRTQVAVVEGALPVVRACASVHRVEAIVCTPAQVEALRPSVPAQTSWWCAPKDTLASLLGYAFHRGVVASVEVPCAGSLGPAEIERLRERPLPLVAAAIGLTDPSNVGALVRAACAFGVDHLLLDARAADPFARKAIRASAGHVFTVQATLCEDMAMDVGQLVATLGAEVVALTPSGEMALGQLRRDRPRVVLFGSEGPGLQDAWLTRADVRACIPMAAGIDSLNVAAASAVTFYALTLD